MRSSTLPQAGAALPRQRGGPARPGGDGDGVPPPRPHSHLGFPALPFCRPPPWTSLAAGGGRERIAEALGGRTSLVEAHPRQTTNIRQHPPVCMYVLQLEHALRCCSNAYCLDGCGGTPHIPRTVDTGRDLFSIAFAAAPWLRGASASRLSVEDRRHARRRLCGLPNSQPLGDYRSSRSSSSRRSTDCFGSPSDFGLQGRCDLPRPARVT